MYCAVAGQLASASAERMQPVLSAVRQLLAQTPERAKAVEQALLDTLSALARVSFELRVRCVMLLNLTIPAPSSAFDRSFTALRQADPAAAGPAIRQADRYRPGGARHHALLVHAYGAS